MESGTKTYGSDAASPTLKMSGISPDDGKAGHQPPVSPDDGKAGHQPPVSPNDGKAGHQPPVSA